MDWTTIILAVIGAISGFSISAIFFPRKEARKAEASTSQMEGDAERSHAEADSSRVEAMGRFVDELQQTVEMYLQRLDDKDNLIESLRERLLSESNARVRAEQDLCMHRGCEVRRPERGQGSKWLEEHADDPSGGADFDPINVLLQKYGKRVRRELKQAKENETDIE